MHLNGKQEKFYRDEVAWKFMHEWIHEVLLENLNVLKYWELFLQLICLKNEKLVMHFSSEQCFQHKFGE